MNVFLTIISSVLPIALILLSILIGQTDILSGALGMLSCITFCLLGLLIQLCYKYSRNYFYLFLFVAIFLWPLINAGISYYLMVGKGTQKVNFEARIGGIGDYISSIFISQRYCSLDITMTRVSLLLMLCTNILFIIPFYTALRGIIKSKNE
jgi:hypothetical protein